jgi:hypothetical protein
MKLNGYASKAAFEAGLPALVTEDFATDMTTEDGQPDPVKLEVLVRVRGLAYLEIKKFPDFNEAIDV